MVRHWAIDYTPSAINSMVYLGPHGYHLTDTQDLRQVALFYIFHGGFVLSSALWMAMYIYAC